mmetsp:Transcript_2075/g.5577  ORF Transcript_2075/g.5577 Transcript_2075/m.5577 type:complete len:288 (-) Transcript_2075:59-922(-)
MTMRNRVARHPRRCIGECSNSDLNATMRRCAPRKSTANQKRTALIAILSLVIVAHCAASKCAAAPVPFVYAPGSAQPFPQTAERAALQLSRTLEAAAYHDRPHDAQPQPPPPRVFAPGNARIDAHTLSLRDLRRSSRAFPAAPEPVLQQRAQQSALRDEPQRDAVLRDDGGPTFAHKAQPTELARLSAERSRERSKERSKERSASLATELSANAAQRASRFAHFHRDDGDDDDPTRVARRRVRRTARARPLELGAAERATQRANLAALNGVVRTQQQQQQQQQKRGH